MADMLDLLASCLTPPWAASSEGQAGDREDDEVRASAVAQSTDLLCSIGHRSLPEEPTELTAATEQHGRALSKMLSNNTSARKWSLARP